MQDAPQEAQTASPEVPCPCCLGAGAVDSEVNERRVLVPTANAADFTILPRSF